MNRYEKSDETKLIEIKLEITTLVEHESTSPIIPLRITHRSTAQ